MIVILQDPVETSSGSGVWEVKCIVTNQEAESDTLHVVFAERNTYAYSAITPISVSISKN